MKDPLGVSPSKGNQGTTRGKEKFLLTSVGIKPMTSGLDLPLLCRLSYEVGQLYSCVDQNKFYIFISFKTSYHKPNSNHFKLERGLYLGTYN